MNISDTLPKLLLLALAGACGTLARYWLSIGVHLTLGRGFPWGTAVVNLLGCLLFGLIWVLADERQLLSPEVRGLLLVGFMGAFTTFSTFIYESGAFLEEGRFLPALANIVFQTVLGFVALFGGFALGRLL